MIMKSCPNTQTSWLMPTRCLMCKIPSIEMLDRWKCSQWVLASSQMLACGIDCEADVKCTEVRPQHSPCFSSWESAVKWNLGEEGAQVSGKWTKQGLANTFQQQSIIVGIINVDILPVTVFSCMLGNTLTDTRTVKRKLLFSVCSWHLNFLCTLC